MTDGIEPGSWQDEAWKHFKAMSQVITEELNKGMPEGLKLVWPVEEDPEVPEDRAEAGEGSAGRWRGYGVPPVVGVDEHVPGRWISFAELTRRITEATQAGIDAATTLDNEIQVDAEELRAADRLIGAQAFVRYVRDTRIFDRETIDALEQMKNNWEREDSHQMPHLRPQPAQDGLEAADGSNHPNPVSTDGTARLSGLSHTMADHDRVEPMTRGQLIDHIEAEHRDVVISTVWHPDTLRAVHGHDHRKHAVKVQVSAVSTGPEDERTEAYCAVCGMRITRDALPAGRHAWSHRHRGNQLYLTDHEAVPYALKVEVEPPLDVQRERAKGAGSLLEWMRREGYATVLWQAGRRGSRNLPSNEMLDRWSRATNMGSEQ